MLARIARSDEGFGQRIRAIVDQLPQSFDWLESGVNVSPTSPSEVPIVCFVPSTEFELNGATTKIGLAGKEARCTYCVVAVTPNLEDARRCVESADDICLSSEVNLHQILARLGNRTQEEWCKPYLTLSFSTLGDPEQLQDVVELVQFVLNNRVNCTDKDRWSVLSSVDEALANGVKHGHRGNVEKHLEIFLTLHGADFEVVVRDQGDGFDPATVQDPREPQNLWAKSGRGILIMNSSMDTVSFGSGGSCVRMRKQLSLVLKEL